MEMDVAMELNPAKPASDDSDSTVRPRTSSVATQACESCRSRKQRCDGRRPRCSGCEKLNKVCEYREVKPIKKDQTLVHILEALDSLESKINTITTSTHAGSAWELRQQQTEPKQEAASSSGSRRERQSATDDSQSLPLPGISSIDSSPPPPSNNRIESRTILAWPAVRSLLQDDLASIPRWLGVEEGGEKWLLRVLEDFGRPLPLDQPSFVFIGGGPAALWNSRTSYVTKNIVEEFCRAFFRVYHPAFPILDRQHFYAVTLPQAYVKSFDQYDQASTKVLLVMALGAVAVEGETGSPICDSTSGRMTGIRGGEPERPPGLAFLSEAKKRIGLMLDRADLNTLQCFILFALYYAQCSRNLEYSHMSELSCTLCKRMVRTVDTWKTFESDLIARSYWMCVVLEGGLATLGLSAAGLTDLENSVPLPLFLSYSFPKDAVPHEDLFIQYHFLAQITLRALIYRITTSLRTLRNPFQAKQSNAEDDPPRALIQELSRQLHAWRMHLPPALNWDDDDAINDAKMSNESTPPQSTVGPSSPKAFDSTAALSASLRTRYKYAQYLIWRPYIYKLLHFPNLSSDEDLQGCQEAFKACSLWPLTFPTFHDHRRLIPHIFEYSHIFFGILVLLHVSVCNPALRDILETVYQDQDIELSKEYFLSWMRDMQVVHPVARWSWQLLRVMYRGHAGVDNGG